MAKQESPFEFVLTADMPLCRNCFRRGNNCRLTIDSENEISIIHTKERDTHRT